MRPPAQKRFAVIADDLTGATDVAAAFAEAGFSAAVPLSGDIADLRVDLVALTTNSRHDSPKAARRKVRQAYAQLRRSDRTLIYKKMDSTLKGNILAEVQAVCDAGSFPTALVCPANPKQGRTVRAGVLKVRGEPATEIRSLLARQGLTTGENVELPLNARETHRALETGARLVIADAQSDSHLRELVRAVHESKRRVLLAGSAGMAAQLAGFLARHERARAAVDRPAPERADPRCLNGPCLVFCGSRNPVTERQVAELTKRTGSRATDLFQCDIQRLCAELECGRPGVIRIPIHQEPEPLLTKQLRCLSSLFRQERLGGVILTGGDTALLVCRWLKASALRIEGELEPGLAWGTLIGGVGAGLPFCAKPGGFGKKASLWNAVRQLASACVSSR